MWHQEQRAKFLTKENYYYYDSLSSSSKFNVSSSFPRLYVMQCLRDHDEEKCGGTADRLKPFLYQLREAYERKRLLLIYWTKPARLEEFLVPPKGGIDWRVPTWLEPIVSIVTIYIYIYYIYCEKGVVFCFVLLHGFVSYSLLRPSRTPSHQQNASLVEQWILTQPQLFLFLTNIYIYSLMIVVLGRNFIKSNV